MNIEDTLPTVLTQIEELEGKIISLVEYSDDEVLYYTEDNCILYVSYDVSGYYEGSYINSSIETNLINIYKYCTHFFMDNTILNEAQKSYIENIIQEEKVKLLSEHEERVKFIEYEQYLKLKKQFERC